MLLAIDTATRFASLALYDQASRQILGEETWHSGSNHTIELMPRLVHMLGHQGIAAADLDGVVVSLGPGSFTGLRIGLSVAKGLVMARGQVAGSPQELRLVGVPTLDIVARPHMEQRLPIWAILRAGRGRVCSVQFTRTRGRARDRWRRREPYMIGTLLELCSQVAGSALFCGELDANDVEIIGRRLGPAAVVASPASSLRRASYLAELGWERLERGDADEPAMLSPIYMHQQGIDG